MAIFQDPGKPVPERLHFIGAKDNGAVGLLVYPQFTK